MKSIAVALSILLYPCAAAFASDQLIPAGSLMNCTLSEPRISSKTMSIGDPVLCRVGHAERVGRSTLPYDSYLIGRFEDYRDPGHFVGKGWMELRFDRLVVGSDMELPVEARVVDVPGYSIDRQGRILGKGHPIRDTIEWMIPVLWPIDLINLPRRGPRPTLKEETRLTLKVMDDLRIPATNDPQPERDPYGLMRRPTAENNPPPPPQEQEQPPAMADNEPQQNYQQPQYAPPQQAYAPPPVYPQPIYIQPPPIYVQPPVYVPMQPMYLAPPMPTAYYVPRVAGPPMWGMPRSAVVLRNGYAYRIAVP